MRKPNHQPSCHCGKHETDRKREGSGAHSISTVAVYAQLCHAAVPNCRQIYFSWIGITIEFSWELRGVGVFLARIQGIAESGSGTVEEDAHAHGFGALSRYQANLPPDVIGAGQVGYLGLVPVCIALQALDSLLDGSAKAGTDLEGFLEIEVVDHGGTSGSILGG
jgi:hypothetical protein